VGATLRGEDVVAGPGPHSLKQTVAALHQGGQRQRIHL
jgi:hypothetical protein